MKLRIVLKNCTDFFFRILGTRFLMHVSLLTNDRQKKGSFKLAVFFSYKQYEIKNCTEKLH